MGSLVLLDPPIRLSLTPHGWQNPVCSLSSPDTYLLFAASSSVHLFVPHIPAKQDHLLVSKYTRFPSCPAFFLFLPWVCWYLLRSLGLQGPDQRMLLYCSFPWVLWFSDISACQNHLEKLLEGRLSGLSPRVGAQETVVPVSSQVMQMLGLEPTLWEPPCQSLF